MSKTGYSSRENASPTRSARPARWPVRDGASCERSCAGTFVAKPAQLVNPNPADARSALVCLLPTGRAAIEKAAPEHVADVRRNIIDLLTPPSRPMIICHCDE